MDVSISLMAVVHLYYFERLLGGTLLWECTWCVLKWVTDIVKGSIGLAALKVKKDKKETPHSHQVKKKV